MDPEGRLRFDLVEEAGDWSAIDIRGCLDLIAAGVCAALPAAAGTVAIVLADDALVQDLNKRFRGKDKPTNVLSFPGDDAPPAGIPETNPHFADTGLGDVVLAAETLGREAKAEGKSMNDHFSHLALHGILHLLGYDHETDEDARQMEALETVILAGLGIADPYADAALAAGDH
jgi:probable rRNA maturation factor